MSELSPQTQRLLDEVRGARADDPTRFDRARVHHKLMRRLAAAAVVSLGPSVAVAATNIWSLAGTKWLAAITIVGAGASYGLTQLDTEETPDPPVVSQSDNRLSEAKSSEPRTSAQVREPATPERAPSETPRTQEPVPEPATEKPAPASQRKDAVQAAIPAPPAPTSASRSPDQQLREETALLQRAQSLLQAGRAEAARRVLDDHVARFDRPVLAAEQQATRILALCALDGVDEARLLTRRFLERWPESPLAPRLRRSCGGVQVASPPNSPNEITD